RWDCVLHIRRRGLLRTDRRGTVLRHPRRRGLLLTLRCGAVLLRRWDLRVGFGGGRGGASSGRHAGRMLGGRSRGPVLLGAGHPGFLDGRLNPAVFPPPRDGDRNGETPLATGLLHLAPPGPVSCAHRTSSPHRAASTTVSATRRSVLARPGRCAT